MAAATPPTTRDEHLAASRERLARQFELALHGHIRWYPCPCQSCELGRQHIEDALGEGFAARDLEPARA